MPPEKEIDLGKLHPKEVQLIYYIRNKFKYGDVVVQTRDGLPYRISRAVEYQELG